MKPFSKLIFFAVFISIAPAAFGKQLTVDQILKRIDEVEHYRKVTMETRQVITTSDGDKRTLKMTSWAVNTGEKQLSVYTYPKRVKGVKMLMLNDGDDIWSYSPRTRRTRHLASHAKKKKVMGSDFTYEDMGGGKMSEKYSGIVLREEQYEGIDCFVLELKPTSKGPSYDKIIAWVGKADFVSRKIDFFEDDGRKPFKTLYLRNVKKISNHTVPMEMLMKNHEDGGETLNETQKIDFDTSVSKQVFDSKRLDRK